MKVDLWKQELNDIVLAIVAASPKILSLVHNGDTPHFIKLNGRRLGRDIETYGLMSRIGGQQDALAAFLEEVVLPLKRVAPAAYTAACKRMKKLGKRVFPPSLQAEWNEILAA